MGLVRLIGAYYFFSTKSMAALLAGVLVGRGVLDPENLVTNYLPELSDSAYAGATVRHLDMQIASGFAEDYADMMVFYGLPPGRA